MRIREKTPSQTLFILFLESKLKVSVFLSNELLAQDQLDLHKYMKGRNYNVTLNCKLGVTLQLIKLLEVWLLFSDPNTTVTLVKVLLTHSLLEILPKTRFEASRVVFWSLSCYKELKLTTNRFTGRTLHGLLIQMHNISLRSLGMRRKFLGLKVTQQS